MAEIPVYTTHAEIYDLIYRFKDYGRDAERLRALLSAEGVTGGARILEAACGTGSYLLHLGHWYDASGFDVSPDVLAIARRKVPRAPVFQADMRDFRVAEPFDALLCLFSSIGYLEAEADLARALRCFHDAVRPGGLVVIEPWFAPDAFRAGSVHMQTFDRPWIKLCRMGATRVEGDVSVLEMHWMVARDGAGVESFVETHRMRLTPPEAWLPLCASAGLAARLEPEGLMPGRGLIVARRG